MFAADLWSVDSLSSANFFFFGHFPIGIQRDPGFPAQVPSGKAGFALQRHCKVFSSSDRQLCAFVMVGGRKSIGKSLLLDGFLRN